MNRPVEFLPPLVVKVGGSLFSSCSNEGVAGLVRGLLDQTPVAKSRPAIVIAGGGRAVERLRQRAVRVGMCDAKAHWLAIQMMDRTTQRLQESWKLPSGHVKHLKDWSDIEQLVQSGETSVSTLAVESILRDVEPNQPGTKLTVGWEVTSDSIAARVAVMLGSPLLLVKSCESPTPTTERGWQLLADRGVVDPFLPSLVGEVQCVEISTATSRGLSSNGPKTSAKQQPFAPNWAT